MVVTTYNYVKYYVDRTRDFIRNPDLWPAQPFAMLVCATHEPNNTDARMGLFTVDTGEFVIENVGGLMLRSGIMLWI